MSNYSKTTDFEAKDSLPTGDSGKIIRGAEFETEFDAISTAIATKADTAGPTFTGTLTFETISDGTIAVTAFVDEDDMSSNSATLVPTQQSVKAYVDSQVTAQDLDFQADTGGALSIDLDSETMTFTGGTGIDTSGSGNTVTFAIDSTVATLTGTQTLTNKTLTAPTISGNLTTDGTIDGRDVATDGAKLDGIEAGATADQTAAEIRTLVGSASDSNVFTDADHSKLDGIEASADVTDTANVTAAGALMDSELTSIASVKALNQGVATTDSPTFAAVTVNGNVEFDGLSGTGSVTVTDILDQDNMSSNSATALATQQSIKAYVDSQVGTVDTLAEVLANGNTTGGTDIAVGTGDDITFADSSKAIFGAGSDLQIYHTGSQSIIRDAGTGDLQLLADANITLKNSAGTTTKAEFISGGAVNLYHNNSAKLATTATGIDVTGTVVADGLESSGNLSFTAADGIDISGKESVIIRIDSDDNDAGRVFQVRSGPTSSEEILFQASEDAGVSLYYDNAVKLATTSSGIDVTGSVVADGLTVDGDATISDTTPSLLLMESDTTDVNTRFLNNGGDFFLSTINDAKSSVTNRFSLDHATGDISFYEDTGTTAKFHWDAADERLGLGTSDPAYSLDINSSSVLTSRIKSSAGETILELDNTNTNGRRFMIISGGSSGSLAGGKFGIFDATASATRLAIDSSGNVGIGTSSPSNKLDIKGTVGFEATNSTNKWLAYTYTDNTLRLNYNGSGADEITIDSSGNVGIGTDSPNAGLEVLKAGGGKIRISETASRYVEILGYAEGTANGSTMAFQTIEAGTSNSTERMRINSSGHLLVGTTDAGIYDDATDEGGHNLLANGQYFNSTASEINMILNRQNSDGDIIQFRRDGTTTVGSIGVNGDRIYLAGTNEAVGIDDSWNAFVPLATGGGNSNADTDLGNPSSKFKDLYLSGTANVGGLTVSGSTPTLKFTDTDNNYDATIQGLSGSLVLKADSGAEFGTESIQFRTGGDEAFRVDSSQNLLIGTTDTTLYNNTGSGNGGIVLANAGAGAGRIDVARDGNCYTANRLATDGNLFEFMKDGSTVGSIGVSGGNNLYISGEATNHAGLTFATDSVLPTRQGTVTSNITDLGQNGNYFKDLYLSSGVYFGNNSSANHLDDYEEGTWTPTFDATTTSPTVAYNTQSAKYTKVGRLVTAVALIITNTRSGGAGHLFISGLPFAVGSGDDYAATIGFNFNWVSGENPEYALAQSGTTRILLYKDAKTNANSEPDDILASGNSYIRVTVSYFTA